MDNDKLNAALERLDKMGEGAGYHRSSPTFEEVMSGRRARPMTIRLSVVDLSGIERFDLWRPEMRRLHDTFHTAKLPTLAAVALLESSHPVGVFVVGLVDRGAL